MDTKYLQQQNIDKVFHPSMFEQRPILADNVKRTIKSVVAERDQRLSEKDFKDIVSKGEYSLTGDNKIGKNNAKYMFKNIYGDTPLTFLFFSGQNVENLQKLIRLRVFKSTQYIIDDQSENELLTVMRGVFLENSNHPPLIHKDMSKERVELLLKKYTAEVDRLNKLVVEYIIPNVVGQLKQYLGYLKDASTQPIPLARSKNESTAGTKNYKSVTQILFGGNF